MAGVVKNLLSKTKSSYRTSQKKLSDTAASITTPDFTCGKIDPLLEKEGKLPKSIYLNSLI
jgi:hypothetical protein